MTVMVATIGILIALGGARLDRPEDEKAIRAADEAFARAFDKGDAAGLAALFTEDAEVVDEGGQAVRGRPAIEAHFAAGFEAQPGQTIDIRVDSLRFLGDDVALEEGRTTLATPDGGPPETGRYTAIHVRRDGRWLQSSVREAPGAEPSPHDRLKAIEWLVGDWVDESDESVVFTSCQWSEGGNFLMRSFAIHIEGKPAVRGTQRIGWDPLTRQVKSWVFDSEGGHGEGLWSRDGDGWVVKESHVLADGRLATATNLITRQGKDTVRWRSVDRTVGDRAVPDVAEIVMVRKPPRPGAR